MTPAQCRNARRLIGMRQAELAKVADIPRTALSDFEVSSLSLKPAYLEAVRRVLETAGVEFIERGVRLTKGGQ